MSLLCVSCATSGFQGFPGCKCGGGRIIRPREGGMVAAGVGQRWGEAAGLLAGKMVEKMYSSTFKRVLFKLFRHVARECQKPKRAKDTAYHREKMLLCKQEEARIQLNAEQADWRDDTDDDELEDQELEAHYMYMAQLQEVSPDAVNSGPIFDDEPLQKVSNDDHYNVFVMESIHPKQSKSVHDTYPIKQDAQNVIIDSLDMNYDREEIDQNDDDNDLAKEHKEEIDQNNNDNDLAKEHELLASLIEKLKCEMDESKNRIKFLETSNKVLIENFKDSLRSQLETQKTQFLNEIDRLSREYYYADHMNAILGVYTELDEVTNLQCDYLEFSEKCESLETELSNSKMMSKSFESVQKHATNLELKLQQCKEKIKNDMLFKVNQTKLFCKEREQYFKSQDLKAQLQDKGIVISELKKLIEKLKGKSVDTKFEKSSVIRQLKSQRPSVLGKSTTFSNSFVRKDFSKSMSATQTNVSNDLSKPVTAQTLPTNKKSIKNTNVLAPRMYKLHTESNQTRTSQLPQDSRKTNKRVSFPTGVIPTTSVSRPQLKSNPRGDRVMHYNSQRKKQEVEDQRRSVKLSKNKTSVTACNDSLNAKTLNVKSVSAMCDKCVLIDEHAMCVLNSVDKPIKKTVASKSNQKPRNFTKKLYEHLVEIVLFIVDSSCSKHMTGNLKLLINFVEKFLGMIKFGNDQIAPILGYGDLGNDLLTGSRGMNLYSITLQDINCPNPSCLMAKATSSQAWLWHRRLSHLNFDTINLLSKNDIVVGLLKLKFVKDHICSSCTKFLNETLHEYFDAEGILHQMSVAQTLEQNGVVDRRNRTLVEAARTMLSAAKVPLFFWAEAISTTCFTQNRSIVIPLHEKTPYHIINDQKPSVKFFYIFGSICYIVRDGENLNKMKEKGDECIFVGYSNQSRAYRVFNKRTRVIMESIHVCFNELPLMASDHSSSDPAPERSMCQILHCLLILLQLVEIVLFIVDSGCSKHMTENLKLLINFVEKFMGTVKFRNDQIASILRYGDLVQGAVTIKRVYYVEGLNHNLFSIGQFCDAELEVAFRKSTCFIRDLKGNDLLTGSRGTDLYSITLQDINCPNTICLMAKPSSSQAWLWHRRLSHLNFDTINLLSKNDIVNLHAYFAAEGIQHQTSVARTPEQNGIVERRNRTLVEAVRTMLSAAEVPLFFWAEAIATACFTQNRSLVIPRHEKTPCHIINDRKPSVKFFHIFGSICYIVRDDENLEQMKEKDRTVTMSNELDLLFSMMFDELLNGSSKVVSTSSALCSADAPNQRQHHTTLLNNHTTPAPTCQVPTLAPTVTSSENINQAETYAKNNQVADDEFINIFCIPVQDQGETSSRHVGSSNMHTFYQRYPSEHHWTKDHPLEQVIGNPLQSVRTRRQLESDAKMCMFALIVSRTEPKNIKEAMTDSAWIESMHEELHQFDRLDVWELVDRPLCTNVINLKWLWKNKCDEENTVIRNKSRLVAKGTLHAYFAAEGIYHQTSIARTPEQNGVVKRQNCTLVEAARTMLSAAKVPLFFWAEAIATACFTQNHQVSSDPAPECQSMALEHDSLSPVIQCQDNVPQADRTITTSNELDFLFSLMFDELLNGSSKVVSKSSVVSSADAPNQRQHNTTSLNNHTTPAPTCQVPTLAPYVTSSENLNQAETYAKNDQVADDEFINIFCTPVQDRGETSSRHVDSSNMYTFYQRYPSALTVSRTKPKNIKEAMADSAQIESM
nr:retrovirus-related Pol polyprotein from transposon TNT 1-94 [Tanacetum cinerariifolium]